EETESEQTDKKTGKKGKPTGKKGEPKEEEKENEQEKKKQRSELAVAYRLIAHIDWKGKILTGDALYCQRWLCAAILLAGGDYLFIVKANQPHLFEDLRLLFAPLAPANRAGTGILRLPEQHAQTTDNGPKIMAALRNTAVSLLRRAGFSTIAARMRYNCGHPQAALHVLSLSLGENA